MPSEDELLELPTWTLATEVQYPHAAPLEIGKHLSISQSNQLWTGWAAKGSRAQSLPGTGSAQPSWGPPCAHVRNASGCAVCLSAPRGHTSWACWTHDEAVGETVGTWASSLVETLPLPLAWSPRVPCCVNAASQLVASLFFNDSQLHRLFFLFRKYLAFLVFLTLY